MPAMCGDDKPGDDKPEANPESPKRKPGSRAKYTCPQCGLNAWAKPGASILCGCNAQPLIETKDA